MAAKDRQAKPSKADKEASARARAIWLAIPRKERPSQDAIAGELEITQGAVSQYFNGKIPFNLKAVLGFARILRCKPEDIRSDFPSLAASPSAVREPPPEWNILRESGWPFAFPAPRFHRLKPDQRAQIERLVLAMVADFEAENRPKRQKRTAARA